MYTGPHIIQDGLVLALDAASPKSYSGSGTNINDLVGSHTATLNGTTSFSTSSLGTKPEGIGVIRLTNNDSNKNNNTSHIQLSSISNITTVSLWYYLHSTPTTRYLLDKRTGGSSGWIYSGGPGSNWSTGNLYINGGTNETLNWSNIETGALNNWRNTTVIANTPSTDDMNLFSRYTDNEGYDISFGYVLIYNRAITEKENAQNYNALKSRFGL